MAPAVKIREFLAARASSRAGGQEGAGPCPGSALKTTPLKGTPLPAWKAKLQARVGTTTPVASPLIDKRREGERVSSLDKQQASGKAATGHDAAVGSLHATGPGSGASGAADKAASAGPGTHLDPANAALQLKLTFVSMPSLPKPAGVSRPAPPADMGAALQRLRELRQAGAGMLPCDAPPATGAAASSAPQRPGAPPPSSPWAAGGTAAAHLATPPPQPRQPAAGPLSPYATPLTRPPFGAAHAPPGAAAAAAASTPLSSPSMLRLRQQEASESGGGFLTHYEDPQALATPPPGAAGATAGGGGGTAAGALAVAGATPGTGGGTRLSVLRSMHRLQQLQGLQREGARLVAAMGDAAVQ